MFRRIVYHLLYGNRVRLTVALLALVSGGAVISALMNLDFDITQKLTQEFRSLGANVVLSAQQTAEPTAAASSLLDDSALQKIEGMRSAGDSYVPYLYLVARANSTTGPDVVVAGTWLDSAKRMSPWWKITGGGAIARDDTADCLIGANAARSLGVSAGSRLELDYRDHFAKLTVASVIDAGGPEDNQIFVNLPVAQNLAGLSGKIELIQFDVPGTAAQIRTFMDHLQAMYPTMRVNPIRQIAEADGGLLERIRFLILSTGLLILVLTALCILATMAALAMERRRDVGLMKALGGSIQKVVRLFLAEVGVLGAAGGVIGYILGMLLSAWMGHSVFGATISPHWEVFPVTVALMFFVSLAGALPLRLLGNVRPAVILRGE